MNGRIYDPTLGRFLQADPFIQAPRNSQSYNRYAYVLNNPLSYTDPSGYFFSSVFKGVNRAVKKLWQSTTGSLLRAIANVPILNTAVQIGISIVCGPSAPACMAAYSGAQTYAVTGSLRSAFTSAAISYASAQTFKQIGKSFNGKGGAFWKTNGAGHIGAHAVTGGVISVLKGGKFGHGFFSAGITKGLTPYFEGAGGSDFEVNGYNVAEATIAGILGGTISQVTGGKFANGAITAAMGNLFNNQRTRIRHQEKMEAVRAARQRAESESRRWAFQLGAVGGAKWINGSGGDAGFYMGWNKDDTFDYGFYVTGTGRIGTEVGTDGGIQIAWGDVYTNELAGPSVELSGGLDTLVDINIGKEVLVGGGTVNNFSVTYGPELSVMGPVSVSSSINYTETWRFNSND